MTDLITMHAKFWEFRRMMSPYWFIPETLDAARFAVTESAEALDAALRRNASYSRNTARSMDEINELGDLAMMLLTAVGEQLLTPEEITNRAKWETSYGNNPATILDDIVHITGCVHVAAYRWQVPQDVRSYAVFALSLIDRYPGMDLPLVLDRRMDRIYSKHHPDAGKSYPLTSHTGVAYQSETPAAYTTEGLL